MSGSGLTDEEAELVRDFVDVPPGLVVDRTDVQRARLAEAAGGGRFRKIAPGLYEIVTHTADPGDL
ncbi:hypothetical protein GCM10010441_75640 [Kitasatospora paracochleata]|uniref:Uncharacterized protein n=1 Tax=Kitasatospora paracochleata TaxID=58354 RepID=A0ABT1JA00_9ACTN|nr:hypothetical protein [Kitasatospora paracochleata]MCP2314277.1 hypothetical protein [Kitasatospora paracochleata]